MNPIPYPPNFHTWGITARAAWLADNHYARNYAAACSMLSRMRRPKRQAHAPSPRLSPQEFAAEMQRRHLD